MLMCWITYIEISLPISVEAPLFYTEYYTIQGIDLMTFVLGGKDVSATRASTLSEFFAKTPSLQKIRTF
jgi:hypothetical protein